MAMIDSLPDRIKPYCQNPELTEVLIYKMRLMAAGEMCKGDDVILALLGLAGLEIKDYQAREVARHLIKVGWLELVGEDDRYAFTARARKCSQDPAVKQRFDEISAAQDRSSSRNKVPSPKSARLDLIRRVASRDGSAPNSTRSGGVPGLSQDRLDMLLPLFVATEGGSFFVEAARRAKELGFSTTQAFNGTLMLLKQAGWLTKVAYGVVQWDLEKVPPKWREALPKKSELSASEQVEEASETSEGAEDGGGAVTVEGESAPVSEVEGGEKPDSESSGDEEVDEDVQVEVVVESALQTDQIGESEPQRLFGLLLAVTVEGLYRQIECMPRELQIMVLNALNQRINE